MSNFKCTYISILTKKRNTCIKNATNKKELINKRVQIAKNFSENIKKRIMETKIGKKNETFLYESDKLSYTDTYFTVMTFTKKQN